MASSADPVVILSAARTPLGRFMGELTPLAAHKLGSHVIGAALERAKLAPERIDEVFMGNVLPAGQGQAPARQAARGARLPDAAGATTVNKVCGSGMKATMLAHDIIKAGSAEIVLSGGMESMTGAPYVMAKHRGDFIFAADVIEHAQRHEQVAVGVCRRPEAIAVGDLHLQRRQLPRPAFGQARDNALQVGLQHRDIY